MKFLEVAKTPRYGYENLKASPAKKMTDMSMKKRKKSLSRTQAVS